MTTPTLGPGHTRDDLDRMPEDGNRYELLEGEIVTSPAPSSGHQWMSGELHFALRSARPEGMAVLSAPFDVELKLDTVVEPDLVVVEADRLDDRGLSGAPLLAVEILSPTSRGRDQLHKKRLYEQAGVPSYWILDPDVPSLTAWELRKGRYEVAALIAGDETWTAVLPFEVTLCPADLAR